MSGNVLEWCSSNWRANYSSSEDVSNRVIRGGSTGTGSKECRVANRHSSGPSIRYYDVGFRVV
jgi:formylglycine-generating enzyme required for sulfatase activity